jgi:hypothetical protein
MPCQRIATQGLLTTVHAFSVISIYMHVRTLTCAIHLTGVQCIGSHLNHFSLHETLARLCVHLPLYAVDNRRSTDAATTLPPESDSHSE